MRYAGSLDTNTVLRLILDDVPAQRQKVLRLLGGTSQQFVVADTALIELMFVLERHYDYPRQAICETVRNFMSAKQITCDQSLFDKVLQLYEATPQLSPEDCVLAAQAQADSATPLYTFDKQLAKATEHAQLIR